MSIDSLGGLRRYFGTTVTQGVSVATTDSIDGSVVVTGRVEGSLDSLVVTGDVNAREIWVRGDQAKHVTGGFEVARVRSALAGRLSLRADTAAVANVGVTSATVALRAIDREHGEFRVEVTSANGPQLAVVGAASVAGDTTVVRFDELALGVREHRLSLERPATLTVRPDGVALDSLRIRDVNAGVLTVAGTLPTTAPIALTIRADSVELGDIGELIQANVPFGGLASVSREHQPAFAARPQITIDGPLDQPRFGDVRLDRATSAELCDEAHGGQGGAVSRGQSVLAVNASIPVDLALASVPTRMLADSLRGNIRSDSVAAGDSRDRIAGRRERVGHVRGKSRHWWRVATADAQWQHNDLRRRARTGAVGRREAHAISTRISNFLGDSVHVDRFTVDHARGACRVAVAQRVRESRDRDDPRFDLTVTARDFHIIDKPRVAHLDVSVSNLRLVGSYYAIDAHRPDHGGSWHGVHPGPLREAGHQPR